MNRQLLPLLILSGLGLCACAASRSSPADYLAGYPAMTENGLINVIVENPAGTNDKWMINKRTAALEWEQQDGTPRVIQYLAYPANYGMVPRTSMPYDVGGDGDPLDIVLLGPQVQRGKVVSARPIGILRLTDDGERDDKIVAVQITGPLSDVTDMPSLETNYPGTLAIIETWFVNYKGKGRTMSAGFENAAVAIEVIREANRYYEAIVGDVR